MSSLLVSWQLLVHDPTTEIKGGFTKVCTVTTADNRIEAGTTLVLSRSCFIKPMSLLEFICAKYKELDPCWNPRSFLKYPRLQLVGTQKQDSYELSRLLIFH
ncbi:Protein CBG26277 [Caenorhabditis briggsae]|uniref:Protein CBG26277 n=1 Tax=Caenorhabditis briggsae TaxID=6238 RepID=B6IJI2_CAEBR|nr:Protein CBG26277 [Caenorhabditis briggsae]CAS00062.1 Protein CBG26277 [Caenorhabditis briggsae]